MKSKVRRLYPKSYACGQILVEPLPKSKSNISGTEVKNIAKDKVVLIVVSKKKPRVNAFFKEGLVLKYLQCFDAVNTQVSTWAMLAKIIPIKPGEAQGAK